jgi:hypothetical protein
VRDRYDVGTIGNYTKNTIVMSAGTRHVDGGGFNYAAFAAAALGLKVATITRLSVARASPFLPKRRLRQP